MKKQINKDDVYKLACIQCTYEEIAEFVGCSVVHLQKKYKALIQKGREAGRKSLRRAQWEKALQGDTRMQIFLGKQYLSQQDQPTVGEDKTPLPWSDDKEI